MYWSKIYGERSSSSFSGSQEIYFFNAPCFRIFYFSFVSYSASTFSLISIFSFWYPRHWIRLWPCFCVINVCYFILYIANSNEGILILCIIFVFNDFCFIGHVVPDNKYIHTEWAKNKEQLWNATILKLYIRFN